MAEASANIAGDLVVQIGAPLSQLQSDLAKAEALTRAYDARINGALSKSGGSGLMNAVGGVVAKLSGTGSAIDTNVTKPMADAAVKVKTFAKSAEHATASLALNRVQMLELQHVGRELATMFAQGVDPLRIFTMESGRIATLFQMGNGGVLGTFRALAPALATVGIAAGGVAAIFAGLTTKINETARTQVNLGEVFKATISVIAGDLLSYLKPAIGQTAGWFQQFVDWLTPAFKTAVNGIINTFSFGANHITQIWSLIPAALTDLSVQAVNGALKATEDFLNKSRAQVVAFLAETGAALGPMGGAFTGGAMALRSAGNISLGQVANPYAGAAQLVGLQGGPDVAGSLFGQISAKSQALALTDAQTKAAKATKELKDNFGQLGAAEKAAAQEMQFYQGTFSGFFTGFFDDIRNGETVWQSLADNAIKALGSISDHLIQLGTNSIFQQLFGSLFTVGSPAQTAGLGIIGSVLPHFANGTMSAPGGLSILGERGPELVNLPRGAQVYNASKTAAMLGMAANNGAANGNGGLVVNNYIDAKGAEIGVEAKIARSQSDLMRNTLPQMIRQVNANPYRRGYRPGGTP